MLFVTLTLTLLWVWGLEHSRKSFTPKEVKSVVMLFSVITVVSLPHEDSVLNHVVLISLGDCPVWVRGCK